ncbi:MAG: transporter substrate-binding domain-containing protein [Carboxydocellales bacterium]
MGSIILVHCFSQYGVDGAISAMTITTDRQKMFNFSDPYFDANQSIAVKANNDAIKSEAELKGGLLFTKIML